jgi:hypothetical protein
MKKSELKEIILKCYNEILKEGKNDNQIKQLLKQIKTAEKDKSNLVLPNKEQIRNAENKIMKLQQQLVRLRKTNK